MDFTFGNGNSVPWAGNSNMLARHQHYGKSKHEELKGELSAHLSDPEIKALHARSQSQEKEILLLQKQIEDACTKELELLSEKHILERQLSELRTLLDEKQDDAISSTLKELSRKKGHLEENMRLANDLKVAEEEVYMFTSSLLSLLAENNVYPPRMNASTITNDTQRLCKQMQTKVRSLSATFGNLKLPADLANKNHQPRTPIDGQLGQDYVDRRVTNAPFVQYSIEPNIDPFYRPRINQNKDMMHTREIVGTTAHYFEDDIGDGAYPRLELHSQHNMQQLHGTQERQHDDFQLPGIQGFEIIGEARPGNMLRACGYPTNGTTLCIFQWVRYHENGTRESIEGATGFDYVVTADDVGSVLAVDCTPIDDSGKQGELVREFANNQNKIACDPDMQHDLDTFISMGRAVFYAAILVDSSEEWEAAVLILTRSMYQIKQKHSDAIIVEEKYSPNLYLKLPNGFSTQFVLITATGTNLALTTDETSPTNNLEHGIRIRDTIVLTMRTFQNKALDGKRKTKA